MRYGNVPMPGHHCFHPFIWGHHCFCAFFDFGGAMICWEFFRNSFILSECFRGTIFGYPIPPFHSSIPLRVHGQAQRQPLSPHLPPLLKTRALYCLPGGRGGRLAVEGEVQCTGPCCGGRWRQRARTRARMDACAAGLYYPSTTLVLP